MCAIMRTLKDTRILPSILMLLVLAAAIPAAASVHNIHLYTDSTPDYVSREDFLQSVTGIWDDPQDQAIAIWRYMVRGHRQTHATREDDRPLFDPIHFYNSYANTFCGYVAGYYTSFVDALGGDWRHRYVELGDHTVAEASWDGGADWHMFDTSMVIYALRPDGGVASCADIQAPGSSALSLALGATGPEPGHDYLYFAAPECMTNPVDPAHAGDLTYPWGYRKACDNPVDNQRTLRNGADSYISGFQVQDWYTHVRHGWRYRLHLRPGDRYTRYWERLGDTEDFYRPAGPNDPHDTTPVGDFHGTGVWSHEPDLAHVDYRLSIHDEEDVVHVSETGPGPNLRPAAAGLTARLDLKIDAANVATSSSVALEGRREGAGDEVRLLFSRDAGINWAELWSASSAAFDVDVALPSALVGGAHEYLLRVEMSAAADPAGCGLDDVRVTTITQVNAFTLPRFQTGENKVRFLLGEQLASQTLWPVLHDDGGSDRYQESAESWSGLDAATDADAFYRSVLRPASAAAPGQVTWRLTTPTPMTRVEYGGSFVSRIDDPGDYVDLSHAFDGSAATPGGTFDADASDTWDGRLYVTADAPPGVHEARLRYDIGSTASQIYNATGIQSLLMTAYHEPRDPSFAPVEVTFNWTEYHDGQPVTRSHSRIVDDAEDLWYVNVSGDRDPRMNWVRMQLADGSVAEGYTGGDPGPGAGYDKQVVRFDWLDDVSRGRPYTVSRAASPENPDDDGDLTNGCLTPPTTYWNSNVMRTQGALWESGAPLTVTLDLGAQSPVAALRVTTHQPNAGYAHPAGIVAEISDDGTSWRPYGETGHDALWRPEGNFLDWGYAHSSAYDDLPAQGRLAFPFWILPAATEAGRHLRLTFTLQDGTGLGLSEIQAFDEVVVEDWPDREIWMPGSTDVDDGPDPSVPPVRLALRCAPNPFNPSTRVEFMVPATGRVSLRVFDVRGREVRVLRDRVLAAGRHVVTWDGTDRRGRAAAAGTYFLVLRTPAGDRVAKAALVK